MKNKKLLALAKERHYKGAKIMNGKVVVKLFIEVDGRLGWNMVIFTEDMK